MSSNNSAIHKYEARHRAGCLEAFVSNVPTYFTNEEVRDFENFLTLLEEKQSTTQYFVLLHNSLVIGCGGFGDKEGTSELSLAWGLIHRAYHKKGFGIVLLNFRLKQIKELLPDKNLVLDTTQHSFGFFEKFGFKTIKITNDFYAQGLHRYDMILKSEKMD